MPPTNIKMRKYEDGNEDEDEHHFAGSQQQQHQHQQDMSSTYQESGSLRLSSPPSNADEQVMHHHSSANAEGEEEWEATVERSGNLLLFLSCSSDKLAQFITNVRSLIPKKEYSTITVGEFLDRYKGVTTNWLVNLRNILESALNSEKILVPKIVSIIGKPPEGTFLPLVEVEYEQLVEVSNGERGSNLMTYKTIVISGESGVGKSMLATQGIATRIKATLKKNPVVTIYISLSKTNDLVEDLALADIESTTTVEGQNAKCLELLKSLWNRATSRILEDYFPGKLTYWETLEVVLVLDELSNLPKIVRGLVGSSEVFQSWVLELAQHKAHGLHLVVVGTALSHHMQDIATDPDLFNSIEMVSWKTKTFAQYLEHFLLEHSSIFTGTELVRLIDSIVSIPLLAALGGNGRCANFLASEVLSRIVTVSQGTPVEFMINCICVNATSIFYNVARSYRIANGIGSLYTYRHAEFVRCVLICLKFSMVPTASLTKDESDEVRKMLIYGMLSYRNGALNISPTIFLLCLCTFGTTDELMVTKWDELEHMVALRAMVKLRISEPNCQVRIVLCQSPIPHLHANTTAIKRAKVNASYELDLMLPESAFKVIDDVPTLINPDEIVILINGSKAPAPDVLVIRSGAGVQLLQIKYSECADSKAANLKDEMMKLGACDSDDLQLLDKFRGTIAVLKALVKTAPRRAFVTATPMEIPVNDKIYIDALDIVTTNVQVEVECIEPIWQQLLMFRKKEPTVICKITIPSPTVSK